MSGWGSGPWGSMPWGGGVPSVTVSAPFISETITLYLPSVSESSPAAPPGQIVIRHDRSTSKKKRLRQRQRVN